MNKEQDALDHLTKLCDLEWNGAITIDHFRDKVQDVVSKYNRVPVKHRK